jgi:hypothetical protein
VLLELGGNGAQKIVAEIWIKRLCEMHQSREFVIVKRKHIGGAPWLA